MQIYLDITDEKVGVSGMRNILQQTYFLFTHFRFSQPAEHTAKPCRNQTIPLHRRRKWGGYRYFLTKKQATVSSTNAFINRGRIVK